MNAIEREARKFRIEKIQKRLEKMKYDEVVLFTCRLAPVVPLSPVSMLFGLVRFNLIKFIAFTFAGSIPRYFILAVLGWYFKSAYIELASLLGFYETLITILIVCVIIFAFLIIKKRHSRQGNC